MSTHSKVSPKHKASFFSHCTHKHKGAADSVHVPYLKRSSFQCIRTKALLFKPPVSLCCIATIVGRFSDYHKRVWQIPQQPTASQRHASGKPLSTFNPTQFVFPIFSKLLDSQLTSCFPMLTKHQKPPRTNTTSRVIPLMSHCCTTLHIPDQTAVVN